MKKVRKIKILVTTREILIARSEEQDSCAGSTDFSICPVCSSPLVEPIPMSVEVLSSPAPTEANDVGTNNKNYKSIED